VEPPFERRRGAFTVSTDPSRLDLDVVHGYLARSYWAEGVPRDVVARSIAGALCFGLYDGPAQVGFARAITDRATYAYLADVFVLERFRGQGLGVWMMECVMAHPDLQGLRRWSLVTRDAHELYRRFGFTPLPVPERYMERMDPDVYRR
jgi:GNAT superfamily N-acetyltransferase